MSQVATEAACGESSGVWTHDASSATLRIIVHYLWRSVSELVTTAYVHAGLCPVTTCGNLPALAPLAPGEAWGGQAAVHHAPHMEGLQRLAQVIQGRHLRHKLMVCQTSNPECATSHMEGLQRLAQVIQCRQLRHKLMCCQTSKPDCMISHMEALQRLAKSYTKLHATHTCKMHRVCITKTL